MRLHVIVENRNTKMPHTAFCSQTFSSDTLFSSFTREEKVITKSETLLSKPYKK